MISVVIPVKNRQNTIERAINSVLSQKGDFVIEIIVVDDASTDRTAPVVNALVSKNKKISLIKNKTSQGGAKARNIGAEASTGDFIAFLDSDDEWLPNHLNASLRVIREQNAEGCFSSFITSNNAKIKSFELSNLRSNNIINYLFVKSGDTRTSTFVFKREAFSAIQFDSQLAKHQDWDIAIRFANKFKFVLNPDKNVKLYIDGNNRMSNSGNYQASIYFFEKHRDKFNDQSAYNFKFNICFNLYKYQGNSSDFQTLLKSVKELGSRNGVKLNKRHKLITNPVLRCLLPLLFKIHNTVKK